MVARITVNASPILTTSTTPTPQSFTQKLIEIDVQLGPANATNTPRFFTQSVTGKPNSNTVTISGARMTVRIQNSGSPAGSMAQVDIYGLTPDLMNQLSTLGMVFQLVPQTTVTIRAGDKPSGLGIVFIGNVLSAYADYAKQPNVPFHFELQANLVNGVAPVPASSFPQATDVGTMLAGLAKVMGLGFQNNGVNVTLPPGYYPGSALDQVKRIVRAADIEFDPAARGAQGQTVLAIWPKGGARDLGVVPVIAAPNKDGSGGAMIDYPTVSQGFLLVKNVYNPQLAFGGQIKLITSLKTVGLGGAAGSIWNITRLDHALDTLTEGGLWESSMWCFNPKYPQPAPPGG
jgi:hypothetical protein